MLMLSDMKVPLSCVRVNFVSQFFILCFRKPTTLGDTLKSYKDPFMRNTIMHNSMHSIHAQLKFRFLFLQFSSIILLIISWSFHRSEPRLCPFWSCGNKSFCSRCEYFLSVRTDVRSLQVVERQVIGR